MKNLNNYISENIEIANSSATPSNTIGMGDFVVPGENNNDTGTDPLPQKKRKKKYKKHMKVDYNNLSEGILDDEETLLNVGEREMQIIKWISEHSNITDLDQLFRNVIFNNDGTIDLPESSKFNVKSYEFNLTEELPEYIKFNNIGTSKTVFKITKPGKFVCKGFPKSTLTAAKLFGDIEIYTFKTTSLIFEKDVIHNADILKIVGKLLEEVWLTSYISPFFIEINVDTPSNRKKSHVKVFGIPKSISGLGIPEYTKEWLLKEWGVISWSTNLF